MWSFREMISDESALEGGTMVGVAPTAVSHIA